MSRNITHQLAETAVGVREVSKQLGRARVQLDSSVRSVLIITKARDNHLIRLTRELALWLMLNPRPGKKRGLVVYVDSQLRGSKRFDAQGIRAEHPHLFEPSEPAHPKTCMQMEDCKDGRHQRTPSADNIDMVREQRGEGEPNGASKVTGEPPSETAEKEDNDEAGQLRYWTSEMCSRFPHLFDLVVTLGGDGTVLFASWLFQRIVPPILPFSLGSLGFLTNFDFSHYQDVLESALDRGIRVNLRMRFTATVYRAELPTTPSQSRCRRRAIRSGKTGEIMLREIREVGWDAIEGQDMSASEGEGPSMGAGGHSAAELEDPFEPDEDEIAAKVKRRHRLQCVDADQKQGSRRSGGRSKKDKEVMCFTTRPAETFEILNDLVVDRGPSPYVSLLEVFGDEHHMTTVQADGLCISTPTGSTAYSLSAGGSLAHPEIPAILLTPICPHTLSFRPMLLPDSMELRIAVPYSSRSAAWASFDGRGRVELRQGDHIKVTASRYPFPTVCAEDQSIDWFQSISRTLKWNERQKQKSFVVLEDNDGDGAASRPKEPKSKRKGSSGSSGGTTTGPDGERGEGGASMLKSGSENSARVTNSASGTERSEGESVQKLKGARQATGTNLPNGHGPISHAEAEAEKALASDAKGAAQSDKPEMPNGDAPHEDDTEGEDDDDESDEDDDDDGEEEEREEEYDITDSSAVVTRANSPLLRSRHGSSYSSLAGVGLGADGPQSPGNALGGTSGSGTPNRATFGADSWSSASSASRSRHPSNPTSLSDLASDLKRRSGGLSAAVGGVSGSGSGNGSHTLGGASLSALRKLSPILRDTAAAGVRAAANGAGAGSGPKGVQMQHHPGMVRRLTAAKFAEQSDAKAGDQGGSSSNAGPATGASSTSQTGSGGGRPTGDDGHGADSASSSGLFIHSGRGAPEGSGPSGASTSSQQSDAGTSVDGRGSGSKRAKRQGAALVVYGDDSSDSDSLGGDE